MKWSDSVGEVYCMGGCAVTMCIHVNGLKEDPCEGKGWLLLQHQGVNTINQLPPREHCRMVYLYLCGFAIMYGCIAE